MPKLSDDDILNIITAELENAPVAINLETPLEYYMGAPNGTESLGTSQLTSTDVADSIEWIMPQVMKSFTSNNEVVTFDPCNQGDERQAAIESEYVYSVLMKKNDGFVKIHEMVKDALIQRNGVLKVYYEDQNEVVTETYTGLIEAQLQMLVAQDNVEILELEVSQCIDDQGQYYPEYNVKLSITKTSGKICVDSVPLEEFRLTSNHNSIQLKGARFTAHVTNKTKSDLRKEGYSEIILDRLTVSQNFPSEYRFAVQGEPSSFDSSYDNYNEAMELYQIAECYVYADVNGDGIAEFMKITTAGVNTPTVILSKEEIECDPWVSTTAILMPHKFQGLSIYDRIKEIQDHKTSLIRNIQDNLYLQNNQRSKILEGQVNVDDLMISSPGVNVRVKRMDALEPIITPQIGPAAFEMMRYLDEVRAGRSGVSAEGSATPQNIGNNVGSEGVDRMMTAKEELVGLIIRVICETGIKPLCIKIRDLARKHIDTIEDFQFRGQWIQVHPSEWVPRSECTVRVGTGSGDTRSKVAALNRIIELQTLAIQQPGQTLVTPNKVYSALDDLCKYTGLNGAEKYFVDPSSDEGKMAAQQAGQTQQTEQAKQEGQQQAMIQMQLQLANAEASKARAAQDSVTVKGQAELAKHQREMDKQTYEAQVATLKAQLERAKVFASAAESDVDTQFKYDQLNTQTALELTKLENENSNNHTERDYQDNLEAVSKG